MTGEFTSAVDLAAQIAGGETSSENVVRRFLDRIKSADAEIGAWTHIDADYALDQARRLDQMRQAGQMIGRLHGVPVGIKDIFDTADMPSEYGSPILAGRQPKADSTIVSALRGAGAVVMGKTVTTEFAMYTPGKTRNPHDPQRTPGGSSSGSAAAVAAGMVPLAIGSQTAGSVIRPASFCGIVGYKPSHGLISRHGALGLSRPLDTVGVFGRTVEDAALLAETLMVYDERDPDMHPRARPRLCETAAQKPPATPVLALVKTATWSEIEPDAAEAFAELAEFLGDTCDEVPLPEIFDAAGDWHRAVMTADIARSLAAIHQRNPDGLSERLKALIEEGQGVFAVDYNRALDWRNGLNAGLDKVFERYDAIITPAAPGQAPKDLTITGNPAFCVLWTYCGVPAISLPLLQGSDGLPIGVQVVGPRGDDARLLRTARWLMNSVHEETSD